MSQFIIILHKRLQYIYLKNISLDLLERIIIQTNPYNERATREEKKNNRQKSFFFYFRGLNIIIVIKFCRDKNDRR